MGEGYDFSLLFAEVQHSRQDASDKSGGGIVSAYCFATAGHTDEAPGRAAFHDAPIAGYVAVGCNTVDLEDRKGACAATSDGAGKGLIDSKGRFTIRQYGEIDLGEKAGLDISWPAPQFPAIQK